MAQPEKRGRGAKKTNYSQLNAVLECLKFITGGASHNQVISGLKLKTSDAYKELANAVNDRLGNHSPSIDFPEN